MPAFCAPAIVDIGEIDDVFDLESFDVPQHAPQHVDAHEHAEIADVPAAVDRQPARVHADGVVAQRREFLFGPCQRVVETHG
jgi:hypothetical protein